MFCCEELIFLPYKSLIFISWWENSNFDVCRELLIKKHRFTFNNIQKKSNHPVTMQRGSQYSILRVQCSTVRRYWSYIVVRAKPFTIQRGERLVVGVQPKADDRALDGSTFTTLCTHCGRRTYVTYSEKMKRL